MATVRSLTTKWGFDVNSKPLREMKVAISEVKAGIMGLGIEAAAAGAAIFGLAEHTAGAAKAAGLAASRVGMGVEEFQKLAFAAKGAGVDADGLTMSLAHMNRTIYEAKSGSKEAMKALMTLGGGVAQSAMRGAPAGEVFSKIAERIKGMKDPAQQTALAMQIFGRSGFQLLPVLKKGAEGIKEIGDEAEEMGLVFSEKAIESAKHFKHELHMLEGNMMGIKNAVGVALLEPVAKVIKAMTGWVKANRELIKQNITNVIKGMGTAITISVKVIGALIGRLSELLAPLGGVGRAAGFAFAAFAIFSTGKILLGIGAAVTSLFELVKAFELLGAVSAVSDGLMLAVPILIGAAVLLMVAALEDVIGYFQGKDSLFGRIIVGFDEMFNGLSERFSKLSGWMKGIAAVIAYPFNVALQTIKMVSGAIGTLVGGGGIQGLKDVVTSTEDALTAPMKKLFTGNAADLTLSDITGVTQKPSAAQMTAGVGGATPANVQTQITVTVPPGTDPNMVGERVEDGVSKGLDNILRPANRSLATGYKY